MIVHLRDKVSETSAFSCSKAWPGNVSLELETHGSTPEEHRGKVKSSEELPISLQLRELCTGWDIMFTFELKDRLNNFQDSVLVVGC